MRSSKALKSFLVLGLLCSMGNLTVKAEEEQTETDVLVTTEWTELTNAQTPVEDETTTEEDLIDPVDEYVAKIGDVGYEKVQDAIEAAENNQIILIQSDVELDELRFEESKLKGKNIILDLNGCTITTTSNCDIVHIAASDFTLTIKNGNLKTKSTGAYALYVYNDKANNKGFDNLNLILDSVNFESINQSFGVQGLNSNQNITIKNCTFTSEVVGLYYPPISGTLKIENSIINAQQEL